MKLCLVTMPWQSLDLPCLPLSLLGAQVRAQRPQHEVRTCYANVRWAEYVLERTGGEVTPDDYSDLVEDGLFHGLGEWVFTLLWRPKASPAMSRIQIPASVKTGSSWGW